MTDPTTAADMCPNCITPWKCNGPHLAALPPSTPPALDAELFKRVLFDSGRFMGGEIAVEAIFAEYARRLQEPDHDR